MVMVPSLLAVCAASGWGCRHVLSQQFQLGAQASGDLTLLLTAIQTTSKFIATNVRKARLINLYVCAPIVTQHIAMAPHGI